MSKRRRTLLWALGIIGGLLLLCVGSFFALNALLGGPSTVYVDRLPVTGALCGTWTTWTTLNSGRNRVISARADDDVWIGGGSIGHWDGSAWTAFAIPGQDKTTTGTFLTAILAVGPDDVWALGTQGFDKPTFVVHYDGTAWQAVPNPSSDSTAWRFAALAASGPHDLWAVGQHVTQRDVEADPVIAHWDGTAWHLQEFPGLGQSHGGTIYLATLVSAAALTPTDAWASGVNGDRQSLFLHWDGQTWHPVPPSVAASVWSLAAIAPDNVWAAGASNDASGAIGGPFLEHWTGAAWQAHLPAATSGVLINAVQAASAADVWATGVQTADSGVAQPLALHWSGSAWQPVAAPPPLHGDSASFDALAVTPAGTAWTVGASQTGGLFPHSNGQVARFVQATCAAASATPESRDRLR